MQSFATFLNTLAGGAIVLILLLFLLLQTLSPTSTPLPLPPTEVAAEVEPPAATSSIAVETASSTTPSVTTPTQPLIQPSASDNLTVVPSTPAPTAPAPTAPQKSQEAVNTETRASLVNILCLPQTGLKGISGSGVIIDNRGIILTNAHIAQYFLLKNYITPNNVSCVIRTGSPAESRYTASLIFLPPVWVAANASQLRAAQPSGTGEHDYAFLLITGRTDGSPLPSSFTRIEMDRGTVDTGMPMLLAAYPAGFLSSQIIERSLYISSAVATVRQLFSFTETRSVDLFSVGGTVVSQGGSSGGAVVNLYDGKLRGILVTATVGASTADRDLRALALSHIDESLITQGKGGVVGLLLGDIRTKAAAFNASVAPGLSAQLEAALGAD